MLDKGGNETAFRLHWRFIKCTDKSKYECKLLYIFFGYFCVLLKDNILSVLN